MLWQPKDASKTKKARETKKSQSQQVKESKDDVFESLDSYDSEEIVSIKRDARNQIGESLKDIRNFVISSLNGKHIFKQRGDTEKEALRGQEALSVDNNPSINTIYIDVNAGKAKVDGMFDCALVETLLNLLILLTVCLKKKLLRWQNRMRCSDYRIQFFK